MRSILGVASTLGFMLFANVSNGLAAPIQFGTAACETLIDDDAANAIVDSVFIKKFQELRQIDILSEEFWMRNKDLVFAVCDNGGSYDTIVVYGKGVVFDYQMIGFLFAQSRAFIVGRYISLASQFDVHAELVKEFVEQRPSLRDGPFFAIEEKALELGVDKDALDRMFVDPEFSRREQTLFLQAMYFLTMHERCHVALEHGLEIDKMRHLTDSEKTDRMQQLELDADECAIDIINTDEKRFKGSPIAFFGILMTVATQSIIANQPQLRGKRSHPSTKSRIDAATKQILQAISQSDSYDTERYAATVRGTAAYFDTLLQSFAIGR